MSIPTSINAAYLGPEASFSHQAALSVAAYNNSSSIKTHLHPLPSFNQILSALQAQKYDYALLPIENSTNGGVVSALDLLTQAGHDASSSSSSSNQTQPPSADVLYPDLEIRAEYYLTVHHCLLSKQEVSYGQIKILYSHPQVWGQCGRFLGQHFTGVERIDVGSTSAAAQLVAKDVTGQSAAIASILAGEMQGLRCLKSEIEDEPGRNTTRFLVVQHRLNPVRRGVVLEELEGGEVGEEKKEERRNWKSMITFTIPHTLPGSLAEALAVFKKFGFNLTSIDTRPSKGRNWHYIFFVECEEQRVEGEKENLDRMLMDLRTHTESLRYLGSWLDQMTTSEKEGSS